MWKSNRATALGDPFLQAPHGEYHFTQQLCLNVKQPSVPTTCPLLILGVKKKKKKVCHCSQLDLLGSPWCGWLNYRAELMTFVITGKPARLLHILHWADSYMWNATNINKTTRDGGKEWIRRVLRHGGGEAVFLVYAAENFLKSLLGSLI